MDEDNKPEEKDADKKNNKSEQKKSKNRDISELESIFKKALDSENAGVKHLENFSLYSEGGFCFPGTLIPHSDHFIMSGGDGKIIFYSKEYEKSYVFDGAGGTDCV